MRFLRYPTLRAMTALGAALCVATTIGYALAPPSSLLGQSLSEFEARRQELRKAVGNAVVVLESRYGDSERERFRPDNDVVYLTGVDSPGAAVVLLPDGDPLGSPCALFVARARGENWAREVQERTGIAKVLDRRGLWETLKPSLEKAEAVYIEGPIGEAGRYAPSARMMAAIREAAPDKPIRDVRPLLGTLRVRKSAGELANLRAAIAATIEGFRRAARAIRPGVTELALEGEVLAGFRWAGAAAEGFPAVIGAGPNSIILHNDPTPRPLAKGEPVVIDIGAEVNYYTADLTRTFPVGGRFTPRLRALYQTVLDVQTACAKHIVAGKTRWSDLDSFAREEFRRSPLRAADSSGELRTLDRFFTHSIGHWLGMDVHDVGPWGSAIPAGAVITIEPGVYIPSENIGIRIEDDYLVTETGVERLSAALPSEPSAVERMMRR